MSIVDEIIQLKDAGDLNRQDGVELIQDLTPDQLKDFALSELIDVELAKRQINYDEENARENAAQETAAKKIIPTKSVEAANRGVNTLGITRLAGDLLSGKPITGTYEDSVLAKDFKGKLLGIDGEPRPDSEIRVFNRLNMTKDKETGEELFSIERVGVPTEYLSPKGVEEQYKIYLDGLGSRNKNQANRFHFNSSNVAEYYGQQGLKLAGYSAPSPEQRSEFQKASWNAGKPFSTLNTNRIIENTPKASVPEGAYAGDYRYVTPEGQVRVGDYQTGSTTGDVKLNLLKAFRVRPNDSRNLEKNLRGALTSTRTNDIDKALDKLISDGVLPNYSRADVGPGRYGMRPGKVTSSSPLIPQNINPYSQYRYDDMVFGLSDYESRKSGMYGMIPQNLVLVDNSKVREIIGRQIINNSLNGSGPALEIEPGGKVNAVVPVSKLMQGTKSGKPLLDEELMSQLRRPYKFR